MERQAQGRDKIAIRRARPEDAERIAQINVASWKVTYRGSVPDATLDALAVEGRLPVVRERLARIAATQGAGLACAFVAEAPTEAQGGTDVEGGVEGADGRAVVGYAFGGAPQPMRTGAPPSDFDSELYAIYLAPGYGRRGLGARLTHAVATHLRGAGARSVLIWALAENPNRGFYDALGGEVVYTQTLVIGGKPLDEVAYGWRDIATLITRTARPPR